ncbi:hypothetical protein ACQCN2_15200 [Brevibacillus ginsengisoli]|uniref:hypothetical protein n=1 Tax=Brevibacillus ginsengisoli TaxID=363854 RepID=UPI003CF45291
MRDRRDFLKLSFQSLVDAVREVALPILEDQSDKIEAITQTLEGKAWAEVACLRDEEKLAQRFVGRHLLFLSRKEVSEEKRQAADQQVNHIEAIDGHCPVCGSSLSVRAIDHTLLCLPCNKIEQPTQIQASVQVFTRLPLKQEGEKWFVEVRKPNA